MEEFTILELPKLLKEFRENWVNVPKVTYFYYFAWFRVYSTIHPWQKNNSRGHPNKWWKPGSGNPLQSPFNSGFVIIELAGGFKYFLFFIPKIGEDSHSDSYFSRWVGSTTNQICVQYNLYVDIHKRTHKKPSMLTLRNAGVVRTQVPDVACGGTLGEKSQDTALQSGPPTNGLINGKLGWKKHYL